MVLHLGMLALIRSQFHQLIDPQCFLSVPPIVYQTLTPRFERSRRWANPYAFAALDIVYTILWLSAFASVAAYNSSGLCFGACGLSKACVALGFFIL